MLKLTNEELSSKKELLEITKILPKGLSEDLKEKLQTLSQKSQEQRKDLKPPDSYPKKSQLTFDPKCKEVLSSTQDILAIDHTSSTTLVAIKDGLLFNSTLLSLDVPISLVSLLP